MQRSTIRAIERALLRATARRRQRLSLIILIAATGLTAVWTGADEYLAARAQRAEIELQLREAQAAGARLAEIRQQRAEQRAEHARLRRQLVTSQEGHAYREQLIELARETGCEVRRIHLSDATAQPWTGDAIPVAGGPTPAGASESPFQLERRVLSLTVSGPTSSIESLLSRLEQSGKLTHTRRLSLKPTATDRTTAMLDLELVLFNLERKTPTPAT